MIWGRGPEEGALVGTSHPSTGPRALAWGMRISEERKHKFFPPSHREGGEGGTSRLATGSPAHSGASLGPGCDVAAGMQNPQMDTFNILLEFFQNYGYLAAFLALVLCGLGLPIPEDITLVAGGVIAGLGFVDVHTMVVVCMAGVLIGDGTMFMAGRFFGPSILKLKFVSRVITPSRYAQVQEKFDKYGNRVLFVARFLPGLRMPIYVSAGISRKISPLRFLLMDGMAALLSVPALVYLGGYGASNIDWLLHKVHQFKVVLGVLIFFGAVYLAFLWYRRRMRIKFFKEHRAHVKKEREEFMKKYKLKNSGKAPDPEVVVEKFKTIEAIKSRRRRFMRLAKLKGIKLKKELLDPTPEDFAKVMRIKERVGGMKSFFARLLGRKDNLYYEETYGVPPVPDCVDEEGRAGEDCGCGCGGGCGGSNGGGGKAAKSKPREEGSSMAEDKKPKNSSKPRQGSEGAGLATQAASVGAGTIRGDEGMAPQSKGKGEGKLGKRVGDAIGNSINAQRKKGKGGEQSTDNRN